MRELTVHYGGHAAVDGLSLSIDAGEIVAVLGANGAGKTSSVNALSGAVEASGGTIKLAGSDITGWPSHRVARAGMVQVPEGRRILAPLTVEENLLMGAYPRRKDGAGVRRDLQDTYDMFPVLADRRAQAGGLLSGGEQQMLAIGRALMAAPQAILLDEPTMGLAPNLVDQVAETVAALRDRGLAVLLVEQNAVVVTEVANRIILLERGRTVGGGTPDEVHESAILQAFLGTSGEQPEAIPSNTDPHQETTTHDAGEQR